MFLYYHNIITFFFTLQFQIQPLQPTKKGDPHWPPFLEKARSSIYFSTLVVKMVPSVKRVTTMFTPSNGLSLSTPMML